MAAIVAAARTPVTVIERTAEGGRKILISGGGRCNVLPNRIEPERFVTDSPAHLVRRMLRAWPLASQRNFFEGDVGVALTDDTGTGKIFPVSNRARDVRDGLVNLARLRNVTFRFDTAVTGLAPTSTGWRVSTTKGDMEARAVILATGGLSVPMTGSDGAGLRMAAQLGHAVHDTYPALTPLVVEPAVHTSLSGLSLPVGLRARWRGKSTEVHGGFLFTHRGYSGPSVLDVSHIAVRSRMSGGGSAVIRVAWSTKDSSAWQRELLESSGLVVNAVARHLPQRLAAQLIQQAGMPPHRRSSELTRQERVALLEELTACVLPWTGDEGYKKAEVTGGGVALDDVDPRTLESRRHPGLFMCGEMLDAFGPIGGHNFAWAWATGRAAGLGASRHATSTAQP